MADKTAHLELTLPANGEYTDNWDSPVNENFEDIDDNILELDTELYGPGGTRVTGALKGSTTALSTRLDTALNADGTLDMETSTDFTSIRRSRIYPVSGAATNVQAVVDRIYASEAELLKLRNNITSDRYGNVNTPDPLVGMGLLAARYGSGLAATSLQSPVRGFTPNCVVDGPVTTSGSFSGIPDHLSYGATSVSIDTGAGDYVMYNIDGMPFKADVDLMMDFTASGEGLHPNATHWLYVSRNEADYGATHYLQYNGQSLGAPYEIDPRVVPISSGLQADASSYVYPNDGSVTVGNSTLTSAALVTGFSTWGCQPGDILVIQNTSDALDGEYVISAVSTDNVTIYGEFAATSAAVEFYVLKPYFPAFGWVNTADTRTATAGRVYIGTSAGDGSNVTSVSPLAYNGVYDTGWILINSFSFGTAFDHHLGVVPSQMEVWVKDAVVAVDGTAELNPTILLEVDVLDDAGGGAGSALDVRFPAFFNELTTTQCVLNINNPATTTNAYTDHAGNDIPTNSTADSIRVILRR